MGMTYNVTQIISFCTRKNSSMQAISFFVSKVISLECWILVNNEYGSVKWYLKLKNSAPTYHSITKFQNEGINMIMSNQIA